MRELSQMLSDEDLLLALITRALDVQMDEGWVYGYQTPDNRSDSGPEGVKVEADNEDGECCERIIPLKAWRDAAMQQNPLTATYAWVALAFNGAT